MLKLLIADSSEEFCSALADMLADEYQIRTCSNGIEALKILCDFRPELLILDLILPGLEGMSVLQQANARGVCPKVLAVTRFVTDHIQMMLPKLNVMYLMRKPCDLNATVARLEDLVEMPEPAPRGMARLLMITDSMLELGVSQKMDGYAYLISGISLAIDYINPRITKDIYPALAKEFHVTSQQVERAISRAIEKAYRQGNMQIWGKYFVRNAHNEISCPTNGEFIFAVANRLRLELSQKS